MAIECAFRPDDGKRLPWRAGAARTEYHETASGLRLRVTASGARSWYVTFWSATARTSRRLKLGDAATMSLAKARAEARRALHAVEHEGRDPYAERVAEMAREREARQKRAEERRRAADERKLRSVTFAKVCAEYIEHRRTLPGGKYGRVARPRSLSLWDSMLRLHVEPVIGGRSPEDVTREDVVNVLESAVKKGGPSMARNVRGLISAVWRWMADRPRTLGVRLPAVSPFDGLPKIGAERGSRDRVLSPAEVWRLWRATEDEGHAGLALRFMLLTATRVRETTELPSSELDLAGKVWNLPAARNKGGRDHAIPLSVQAIAVLNRTRALAPDEHVFGRVKLHEPTKAIRAAMGGAPWEPRDLRRTAATICARLGADPFVVSLLLGHASADTRMPTVTGAYLKWGYGERVREALARLGAWVAETVTRKTPPGDVVAFETRRA